jgi:hypothetical protein
VKLVDVEKVEWLNRRSYSVIGLLLGREGRVLLRSDSGLEDWFELLEECTLSSKERRLALRLTQGPRSRASLAAPPTHASLQSNHLALGSTYSSALEDWLHSKNKSIMSANHFMHADSVPDLSALNENSGLMTNQSTPKKIPKTKNGFHIHTNGYASHNGSLGNNSSYTPYSPLKKLMNNNLNNNNNNSSCLNGNSYIINDADEDEEVELRQHNLNSHHNGHQNVRSGHRYRSSEREEDIYRRPFGPNEQRHSCESFKQCK